jgi:ribonuclease HI
VRFEKACTGYSLRTLLFQPNHPIIQAYYKEAKDKLADQDTLDLTSIVDLQPDTQLYRLILRLKDLVKEWNLEKPVILWDKPWASQIQAKIHINTARKKEARKQHLKLLESLDLGPKDQAKIAVIYTDGSQGGLINPESPEKQQQQQQTNAAIICRIGPKNTLLTARYWNLGTAIKVADAELIAITKALELAVEIREKQEKTTTFYIFVDSQAAIHKLYRSSFLTQRAKGLCEKLQKLKCSVNIHWCPSHKGIAGNEIADQLAKTGLKAKPSSEAYVSLSYLRRTAREAYKALWKANWSKEETGRGKAYSEICGPTLRFSFKREKTGFTKADQSAYIQLKTGVGFLNSYLQKIGKKPTGGCICGADSQTTRHLILYCSIYNDQRKKLQKALGTPILQLRSLFCTKKGKEALREFLSNTKICTTGWAKTQG